MLTVLMALFIVLFAISNVDKTKAEQVATSAREYFGSGPTVMTAAPGC
jgi:flagellar motor protein MotB